MPTQNEQHTLAPSALEHIKEVTILRPQAGDVVFVDLGDVDYIFPNEYYDRIREEMRVLLPEGVKVGILMGGVEIKVVRADA